jgi:SAM-dependent methyltransferase
MISEEAHNERAWDDLVRDGSGFANPARPEDFLEPDKIINPFGWLAPQFKGLRILCLAAGGGRHGPVFAAQGAEVTVVDISEEMLKLDLEVARREGVTLKTSKASMTDLREFGDAVFDIVLQPVSSCYVEDISVIYREVARVITPGGTYVSQHKQPISLQAATKPLASGGYAICEPYYREGHLPPVTGSEHREVGTIEYLHTLESLLGGLCQAGFLIEDLKEPRHASINSEPGSFQARSCFVPPYIAIKATRHREVGGQALIWSPS